MYSSLRLDWYEIVSCSYKKIEVKDSGEGKIKINQQIFQAEEDPEKWMMQLKTVVRGIADIEIVINGHFTIPSSLDKKEQGRFPYVALHLLFPFVRSYIHTISCQDGRDGIMLPVFNTAQLLSDFVEAEQDE